MLLKSKNVSLLLIDIQERLLPVMTEPERVVSKCRVLLQAAATLAIPITVTQQYPKGLGPTIAALADPSHVSFDKLAFSCWREDAIKRHFINLHEHGRPLVIVAGIEAHVCVLQSAMDLANAGFGVFAVADAMSSRAPESAKLAFERMRANDVQVINTEMAVFELLEKAGTPAFKVLSALIR